MAGDAEKPGSDPIYFSPFDGLMDLFNLVLVWCSHDGPNVLDITCYSLLYFPYFCFLFSVSSFSIERWYHWSATISWLFYVFVKWLLLTHLYVLWNRLQELSRGKTTNRISTIPSFTTHFMANNKPRLRVRAAAL